jgi:drug/metabolite transporter (DMT)-like permease
MRARQPQETLVPAIAPLRLGFTALIIGNICLAFGPLFVRLADTGPVAAAFWRMALAVPALLVMVRISGQRIGRPGAAIQWIILLSGVFFAADLASWHIGVLRTKLANSNLFGNSTSFIYPLYGFLIARHWPSRTQTFALMLAGIGAALLLGRSYELSPRNFVGDLFCILAGILYTVYLILMAKARDSLQPWAALALTSVASVLPLLMLSAAMGERIWPHDWTPLVMLALLSQVLGQGCMIYVIGRMPPLVIGLTLLTQPIVAAILGWRIFGEQLGAFDLLGAAAIGCALVLVRQPAKSG